MFGHVASLVACTVPGVLGRLVRNPWFWPYDAFPPFDAAATAVAGICCGAIGLGSKWLPEIVLEGVPVVAGGFDGVATVFPCEIEDTPGEAIFVSVTVAKDAEPCLEGTSLPGDTEFRVCSLVVGVLVDRML